MIRLDAVTKVYPGADAPAVDRLTLDVAEGEVAVLVGPSGCGKTTTLKMINRLVEPTEGTIEVAGRDVKSETPTDLRRRMGYVIQHVGLFPHRTVSENVATVPRLLGWDRGRIRQRVDELIELVDLERSMLQRYPSELSGGQRQRVGVARALAADPPVLLMDEPFGAVDPIVRARLQEELLDLQGRLRKTIVFVTHDIDEAIMVGDRVAVLAQGGRLEQYDTPAAILAQPATAFVEAFLGRFRGIRRLSVVSIRDVRLERGPVIGPGDDATAARAAMEAYGVDWFGVADGDEMLGWLWASELDDGSSPSDLQPREFKARVRVDDTLRDALDTAITTHTRVAPVFSADDRYLGMISVDAIARELTT
jgi:osmoprotectant transport system ATP-binding protein